MNFNEEKIDNVKKVGTNIFHKIKELKNKMTNLEDSGGKIILISKWCLNISFYLMLVLFVVWMFVGIRFSMVYHWGGYYSNGYYSFITKGDANLLNDKYVVDQSMIVGEVRFKIPFVGLPTVWLSGL